METDQVFSGKVFTIRKLGGIIFIYLFCYPLKFITIICESSFFSTDDFALLKRIKQRDRCSFLVKKNNNEYVAIQLLCHFSFEKGAWELPNHQIITLHYYSILLSTIRSFFNMHNFIEVRLPTIHYGNTKSSLFSFDFFRSPARLSSSNALYSNAFALQIGPVYSIQRCYRAEKSKTYKHLSEFDMLEVTIPDANLDKSLTLLENLIRHIVTQFSLNYTCSQLKIDWPILSTKPFLRESYEAIDNTFKLNGRGLGEIEKHLSKDGPIFIVNFPNTLASWSAEKVDACHAASFNLLLSGVGEVAEGTQRCCDLDSSIKKFKYLGIDKQLSWYSKSMVYKGCRSSGFGLGLERLAMWLFGKNNIRQLQPFFRDTKFSEVA